MPSTVVVLSYSIDVVLTLSMFIHEWDTEDCGKTLILGIIWETKFLFYEFVTYNAYFAKKT